MDIFGHIEKNIKIVKNLLGVLLLMPVVFQLLLSPMPLRQRCTFALYSIIFLLLGFGGIYIALGLQAIMKVMPKRELKATCNFCIVFGMVILLFQYPANLIAICFIYTVEEALTVAFMYNFFGLLIGSYKIKNEYTTE